MAKGEVEALDISKIKDLSKITIKPNYIVLKLVSVSKSGLILPGQNTNTTLHKAVVVNIGTNVTSINLGDIVVDMSYSNVDFLKNGEDTYILTDVYNVLISVSPDNYLG